MRIIWMRIAAVTLFLGSISAAPLTAQEFAVGTPILVHDFPNLNSTGSLYARTTRDVGPQDDRTGNDLVFDESGTPIIYQFERREVIFLDPNNLTVVRTLKLGSNLKYLEHLVSASEGVLLFWHVLGRTIGIDFSGKDLFSVGFKEPRIESVFYHSGILWFSDSNGRINAVKNPSLSDTLNRENLIKYENIRSLFANETRAVSNELSLDDKGRLLVSDVYHGPVFMPVVGVWKYTINEGNITVGNLSRRLFRIAKEDIDSNGSLESVAIHPSGDIYFLRFNQESKSHRLLKLENVWDPSSRQLWRSKK